MNKFLDQIKTIWSRMETAAGVHRAHPGGLHRHRRGDKLQLDPPRFQRPGQRRPRPRPTRSPPNSTPRASPTRWPTATRCSYPAPTSTPCATTCREGLLGDGSSGFKLLDKTSFGASTFMERKNYDRAVSGELERSFKELPSGGARVDVQPPPSPFLEDERQPSASVKLQMTAGRLTERQVAGIVRLTAGAVEGLQPDRVQVMDDSGLLTRDDDDPAAMAASTSLEAEQACERHLPARPRRCSTACSVPAAAWSASRSTWTSPSAKPNRNPASRCAAAEHHRQR